MAHAVRDVAGGIPLFRAEVRVPARVEYLGAGELNPRASALHLEPGDALLAGLQGVKLGGELHHPALHGVEGEGDDLVAGNVHRRGRRLALPLALRLAGRGGGPVPPLARGEGVEVGELGAERRGRVGRSGGGERGGAEREGAGSGKGEFEGGAAVDRIHAV